MITARLIPELEVDDLDRSLAFYTGVVGAIVLYARPEERFAFLELDGADRAANRETRGIQCANLMLEEAAGPGRRLHGAPLEHPYGRGVNFQIQVANVDALHARVLAAQARVVLPMEDRWYRRTDHETGNRQFVVADPDGYLLRFFTDLGQRPCG
jgi:catechol 2,3-dioxygenase-like lactoylglutathione lyase family enzyme